MEKDEKLEILQKCDEKTLTQRFVIPLYESEGMGYKNIRYTHGTLEFGKDVVCHKEDEHKDRIYIGIQVKKTKIEKKDASIILSQILEAFSEPFIDSDGRKKKVDKVILLTSNEFSEGARRLLTSSLESTNLDRFVKYVDGNKLVDMLDLYLPSIF